MTNFLDDTQSPQEGPKLESNPNSGVSEVSLRDDKEDWSKSSAFSLFKKEHKVQFAEFPQVSTFRQENAKDEILHECCFCNKLSSKTTVLNGCNHNIHPGCLKLKTISLLLIGKSKIFCPHKDCTSLIERDKIVSILNNIAKIVYDTLCFIYEYSNSEPDKVLYWCYRCRLIDCKSIECSSKCMVCSKRQDKLKFVFSLSKLVLSPKDPKFKTDRNYSAIMNCLEDCRIQLSRCETCTKWKHSFLGISQKCLC